MEFWGVEVKAGETLKVSPGDGKVIHLSQASIGESKKGKGESAPVFVKVDEQKLLIGTLSSDKFPQIQYDVVFDKDFELSHNWKNGSVFFCGYKAENPLDDGGYSGDDYESDNESEDEDLPLENGKPTSAKAGNFKPAVAADTVKIEDAKADSDDDSSDEDDSDDESDDDEMDSDDSDESSEEEDEKTPTPQKDDKKRPTEAETKAPVSAKKAKLATPQKTDGKKPDAAAHTETPHPAKQFGKNPKSNSKTPASAVKPFNSNKGQGSHSKAKHAAK